MIRKTKLGPLNGIVILINLILSFIIVLRIIKGLHHISSSNVVKVYKNQTIDELGGEELILQSNHTFIYKTWLDIAPDNVMRGKWGQSNDTIVLNGYKCFKRSSFLKDTICYTFKDARFRMYHDSLVFISGESRIHFIGK